MAVPGRGIQMPTQRLPLRGNEPRHNERESGDGRRCHFLPKHEPTGECGEHGNHVLNEAHLDGAEVIQ